MRKSLFSLSLLTSLTLVSCSAILNHLPGVYTLEIQQGNIIDQVMIDQLRPGMNKRQVLYIMGSPMLDDVFHKNRWDYLYSDQPGGEDRVQKQLSLFFENDQIVGIQGNFRPSAVPVIKTSAETTVDIPKRDLEKTLWEKITGLVGYDDLDTPTKYR
jgi:outer membrane protein assembly factor BamE